jgi:hypothetical protein
MKATIAARMIEGEKILIDLSFSGKGSTTNPYALERAAMQYKAEAEALGMKYMLGTWTATVEATPEACAPFVAFAEKHGIAIIQL